jgi:predicted PurR-regulated permease PerM
MQSSEWKSDLAASGIAYVERLPEPAQYFLKSMANVYLGNVDSPKQEAQDILIQSSIDKIEVFLRNQSEEVINTLTSSAKGLFSAFTTGIIVFFLTFFMLNNGEEIKKTFIRIVPNRFFEPFLVLLDGLNRQLGDYLRSRVIQTILLSALCAIGYWVLGLKFALILGFIAGLANLIPYIGPFIGAIPAVIIALIEIDTRFGFGWSLIGIGLITIAVQVIDNAVIFPLLIGKSVELGPITTIVVVLLGEQFFGFIGLLMAVPITAMIKLTASEVIVQFNGYSKSIIHGQ